MPMKLLVLRHSDSDEVLGKGRITEDTQLDDFMMQLQFSLDQKGLAVEDARFQDSIDVPLTADLLFRELKERPDSFETKVILPCALCESSLHSHASRCYPQCCRPTSFEIPAGACDMQVIGAASFLVVRVPTSAVRTLADAGTHSSREGATTVASKESTERKGKHEAHHIAGRARLRLLPRVIKDISVIATTGHHKGKRVNLRAGMLVSVCKHFASLNVTVACSLLLVIC